MALLVIRAQLRNLGDQILQLEFFNRVEYDTNVELMNLLPHMELYRVTRMVMKKFLLILNL